MSKTENILTIAAHPDDEALGCGGTLARHVVAGDRVQCLFLADGAGSRGEGTDVVLRQQQAEAAARKLGAAMPILLDFPDNRMDCVPLLDIVQAIEKVIAKVRPDIIYTHHGNDLNIDHRIVHQAVLTACRPQPGSCVRAIYGFEVPSSTEWASVEVASAFRPVRFVSISDFLQQKLALLDCYAEEMRPSPHARSREAVEALAKWRGATVGVAAAEAYSVIREIVA